jgi:hypothetical protein
MIRVHWSRILGVLAPLSLKNGINAVRIAK